MILRNMCWQALEGLVVNMLVPLLGALECQQSLYTGQLNKLHIGISFNNLSIQGKLFYRISMQLPADKVNSIRNSTLY